MAQANINANIKLPRVRVKVALAIVWLASRVLPSSLVDRVASAAIAWVVAGVSLSLAPAEGGSALEKTDAVETDCDNPLK